MIIPDPTKKTVKIPIRIVDGNAEYFYGGPFPKLKNVIGDLVVPAFSLTEHPFVEECSETGTTEMLPKGTILMMNVWAEDSALGVVRNILSGPQSGNVTVRLLEPLFLWHRGTKSSVLKSCRCLVPALNEEASSLNHAYTIISKKYETKRRSNTGNVFLKAYFEVTENFWAPLQALRDVHDAEFERRYSTKQRGQETEALSLSDSSVIERSVLREVDGHRLVASIDPSGLTIEEHKYHEASQHTPQTVKIGSPHRVLLELLKDRFTTVAEFDKWLESKGIHVDFRSALPGETEDDLFDSPDEFVATTDSLNSRVEARKDSLDPNASIFVDFDHEDRFVEVNEASFRSLDKYFAEGWIHVGSHFVRRPLVPTKTVPLLNIPARIRLSDFHFSKHQRRILRKNSDVQIDVEANSISIEDEELFDRHKVRFAFSPPKSIHNIVPKSSLVQIKKITVRIGNRLLAASYLSVGTRSAYSIYGMFEPSIESRSLGILTMLNEIEFSVAAGTEFYYLGYVFGFPSFYDYKKQFHGLELFDWKGNWIKADRISRKI